MSEYSRKIEHNDLALMTKFQAQMELEGLQCRTRDLVGGKFKKTQLWLENDVLYWNTLTFSMCNLKAHKRSQTQSLALQDITRVNRSVDVGSSYKRHSRIRQSSCFEVLATSSRAQGIVIEAECELAKDALVEGFELLLRKIASGCPVDSDEEKASMLMEEDRSGSEGCIRRPRWEYPVDCSDLVKSTTTKIDHHKKSTGMTVSETDGQHQTQQVIWGKAEREKGSDVHKNLAQIRSEQSSMWLLKQSEAQLKVGMHCRILDQEGQVKKTKLFLKNDILYWNASATLSPKNSDRSGNQQSLALQDVLVVNRFVDLHRNGVFYSPTGISFCVELLSRNSEAQNIIIKVEDAAFLAGFQLLLEKFSSDVAVTFRNKYGHINDNPPAGNMEKERTVHSPNHHRVEHGSTRLQGSCAEGGSEIEDDIDAKKHHQYSSFETLTLKEKSDLNYFMSKFEQLQQEYPSYNKCLVSAMKWPIKAKVYLDGRPCSAHLLFEQENFVWVHLANRKFTGECCGKMGADGQRHYFPIQNILALHANSKEKGSYRNDTKQECCMVVEVCDEATGIVEAISLELKDSRELNSYIAGFFHLLRYYGNVCLLSYKGRVIKEVPAVLSGAAASMDG